MDIVACAVFRRCTTSGGSRRAKRTRRDPLQAIHGCYHATHYPIAKAKLAVVCYKQPNNNKMTTCVQQQESNRLGCELANTLHTCHTTEKPTPAKPPWAVDRQSHRSRARSLETTPPRRARHQRHCRRSSKNWTGFSPRDPHATGL